MELQVFVVTALVGQGVTGVPVVRAVLVETVRRVPVLRFRKTVEHP